MPLTFSWPEVCTDRAETLIVPLFARLLVLIVSDAPPETDWEPPELTVTGEPVNVTEPVAL